MSSYAKLLSYTRDRIKWSIYTHIIEIMLDYKSRLQVYNLVFNVCYFMTQGLVCYRYRCMFNNEDCGSFTNIKCATFLHSGNSCFLVLLKTLEVWTPPHWDRRTHQTTVLKKQQQKNTIKYVKLMKSVCASYPIFSNPLEACIIIDLSIFMRRTKV